MVKAPLEGAAKEQAGVEEWEWAGAEAWERDLEEGGWVAQDREPALQGSAYVPNAVPQYPIKSGYPATRYSAPSVAHPWSENNAR